MMKHHYSIINTEDRDKPDEKCFSLEEAQAKILQKMACGEANWIIVKEDE